MRAGWAAAIGAGVGAVVLAAVLAFMYLGDQPPAAEAVQATDLSQERAPTYSSPQEIAEKLGSTSAGCTSFAKVAASASETAAGECFFQGAKGRIALYESQAAVGAVLDGAEPRDAYGMPVMAIAGENWLITVRAKKEGKDDEIAKTVAETLGGAVIFSE